MECKHFGECGSCTLHDRGYKEQLGDKKEEIRELFSPFGIRNIEVFPSDEAHYRARGEFRIWHNENGMHYAMNRAGQKNAVVLIEECPKVLKSISSLMEPLRQYIQSQAILKDKLFSIEFLATNSDILVSMLYHKPIDESWCEVAKAVQEKFDIKIIGRSRKIKKVLKDDFVLEKLHVQNKEYMYKIYEGAFSQPNPRVNEKMIAWAMKSIKAPKDLLELYCGHGNFTVPFAILFDKILATEISKSSIKAARQNCELNHTDNIEFLRMSVEELTSAFKQEREFKRLQNINLKSYDFSHVFVDPPRAGIDTKSLEFISHFETIVYISCNPQTLKSDIKFLESTHEPADFALFDQFPYTKHMEAGVILKKYAKIKSIWK